MTLPPESIRHHGTHVKLLVPPPPTPGAASAQLDAIIVPTHRPVRALRRAIRVGRRLDCPVLVLCSGDATAAAAVRRWAGADILAVDITGAELIEFRTATLPTNSQLKRRTDTSLKRNIGLAVAVMAGWRRIVFLDDDMKIRQSGDIAAAASLLDRFPAVGLHNVGYPDNSVVCHAYRAVGGDQTVNFIGGGALAMAASPAASFFPTIYNEDWFALLGAERIKPVTVTGTVKQERFNPYDHPQRAQSQEFGDCLGEGIFALLDNGGAVGEADRMYWGQFLADRRRLIEETLASIPRLRSRRRPRTRRAMEASLDAARKLHDAAITPDLCVEYLTAWQQDTKVWEDYLSERPLVGIAEAVRRLDLTLVRR